MPIPRGTGRDRPRGLQSRLFRISHLLLLVLLPMIGGNGLDNGSPCCPLQVWDRDPPRSYSSGFPHRWFPVRSCLFAGIRGRFAGQATRRPGVTSSQLMARETPVSRIRSYTQCCMSIIAILLTPVFPDPVSAAASTSPPVSTNGTASCWIGVGKLFQVPKHTPSTCPPCQSRVVVPCVPSRVRCFRTPYLHPISSTARTSSGINPISANAAME